MTIYNGFSTVNRRKKYRLNDFELAQQDLINHLHIRKGEKLMNPDFGTIIWDLLFEPLTPDVKSLIQNDLTTIVSYDPRLAVDSIAITEFEQGIQVNIDLTFIVTNQTTQMKFNFDRKNKS